MKCFVTGASGFIGSNLVQELLARGHRVKVLLRPKADEHGLLGLKYERVTGDLTDRRLLERELEGCDWCFHLAASVHLWLRNYAPMHETNVEGTRNVILAAGRAGCQKIIHCSTAGCIGQLKAKDGTILPATESEKISDAQLCNDYLRSKFRAEAVALELFRKQGLPVIIVNPSAPVGPGDAKPTPTGQFIVDFLNRRLPAYINTGLNWVPVRDVAIGHILAAEKGHIGERYILGNQEGNWTLAQTLAVLEEVSGVPAPRKIIPRWIALRLAEMSEYKAKVTRRPPKVSLAAIRMTRYKMWYDSGKAIRELGLPQTPPKEAFAEAVRWFRHNNFVKK